MQLPFLKKKSGDEISAVKPPPPPPPTRTIPHSDFLPYFCHYDAQTLLTKNGELMQTIRIAGNAQGRDYESGGRTPEGEECTVRNMLRRAIGASIQTDDLSLWIHTVRKREPIRHDGRYREPFAAYVHKQWRHEHPWKHQYRNEIYVTLLHDGQSTILLDKNHLNRVILAPHNRRFRHDYLEAAHATLNQTVTAMLDHLRPYYNAERLSVVERLTATGHGVPQPVCYSEPMEFLSLLFNLHSEEVPLPEADISKALCSSALTFGFNALETRRDGKRRFAAILTLKQYREMPGETVDRMMQAPMEFIVSQAFRFIPAGNALKEYKEQKDLFDISGDTYAIKASGIEDMLRSHKKRPVDFGDQQTSIMVLVDDFKQVDTELAHVQDSFPELGLVTIREDIKLEESFWAQFPGNFEFMRRRTPINTNRIAGFCRLNRFPTGVAEGNHWGEATALIPTMVNSPYFFNFHVRDNGHTLLFDFNSFNDHVGTILTNFLLSESRKFGGKLIVFDHHRSAQFFCKRLGGHYHLFPVMTPDSRGVILDTPEPKVKLNPFTLEASPRNLSFLLAWCGSLIAPDIKLPDAQRERLRAAIEVLYAGPPEQRHLTGLITLLSTTDAPLAEAFAPWHGQGKYAGLVDATQETLDTQAPLNAFDMNQDVRKRECVIPVFSYLLHRVITAIDGQPTIIVLHQAWELLENAFFAPRLESLLEMLKQNNVMVISTTAKPADCADTHILNTLIRGCATHLYVPDDIALNYVSQSVGQTEGATLGKMLQLNEYDAGLMRRMQRQKGDFLVKQSGESIALRVDLTGLNDIHAIFANDIKNPAANEDASKTTRSAKPKRSKRHT